MARRRFSEWFSAGVRGYGEGKKQAFAKLIGISEGFLSKACAGKKAVPSWSVVAFEGNAAAVLGFTAPLLASARLIAVPLMSELVLEPGQAAVLRHARTTLGELWPAWRDRLAAHLFRCEGDLLEAAIDLDAKLGK